MESLFYPSDILSWLNAGVLFALAIMGGVTFKIHRQIKKDDEPSRR